MNTDTVDIDAAAGQFARSKLPMQVAWRGELGDFARSLVRVRMLRALNRDAATCSTSTGTSPVCTWG